MSKVSAIGMIVEDDSDFESFRTIIKRVVGKDNLKFRKQIGHGCGKLKRKASSYLRNLSIKGCNCLILVHDLDRNNESELRKELGQTLKGSPAEHNLLCIPKEEIEAWFLADPDGIKNALGLNKKPNIKGLPETIPSPKKHLEKCVEICSSKQKLYLNTKHNKILSEHISLDTVYSKCDSYKELQDFVLKLKY